MGLCCFSGKKRCLFLFVFVIVMVNVIEQQLELIVQQDDEEIIMQNPSSQQDTTRTIQQQHYKSKKDARALKWFLHFHKAAGTSFTDLAWENYEIVRHKRYDETASNDHHGHLELDAYGKIRWNDLIWPNRTADQEKSCLAPGYPPNNQFNELQSQYLDDIIATLHQKKITFVSTEHWFPSTQVLEQQSQHKLQLIMVIREPIERLVSSYHFHSAGGLRCPRHKRKCFFSEWWQTESNMHVKMLNGIPFDPILVGAVCGRKMWTSVELTQHHYDNAIASLKMFDVVLTLDSVKHKPKQLACVLRHALGWNVTSLPKNNALHKNKQNIDPAEITKAKEAHSWDIKFYQQAQQMEQTMFQKMGCV